jgi:UDP-N-acetyl-D-mannosaminuronate dehydrogenase
VIVMLVDHTSFKQITPANIGNRALVDTRGVWQTSGN